MSEVIDFSTKKPLRSDSNNVKQIIARAVELSAQNKNRDYAPMPGYITSSPELNRISMMLQDNDWKVLRTEDGRLLFRDPLWPNVTVGLITAFEIQKRRNAEGGRA